MNLSQGGVCLQLKLDVPWETLTPEKKVTLLLNHGEDDHAIPAVVIRHERDHRTIGLRFSRPLSSLSPFFTPLELKR